MPPTQTAPAGTRERILAYLEENRSTTVTTLSQSWGLTRADIRYHLNHLVKEGLVERVQANDATAVKPAKSTPRGRPTSIYRLASLSAPDNFAQLAAALLDLLAEEQDSDEREALLKKLAVKLAGESVGATRLTSARFNQAVEVLNRQAYRARWEASPAGPRVLLRSCPYAAVIDRCPALCRMDLYLLEHLLGVPLTQAARMGRAGGPPACVFLPR